MESKQLLFSCISLSILLFCSSEACRIKCNLHEIPTDNCRKCICKNKFINLDGLGCVSCKPCQSPMVIVQECSDLLKQDTQCGPCPKGTFYSNARCTRCKSCPAEISAVQTPCGVDTDTVCKPHYLENKNLMTNCKNVTMGKEDKHLIYVWLFWFSLAMNMLLVLLVGYMCVRRNQIIVDGSSLATCTSVQSFINKKHETLDDLTEKEKSMNIRDLSGEVFQNLAKLLNPSSPNNWKTLAGRIGFTSTEIANFALIGGGGVPEFTQNVLASWASKNTATVDALARHLIAMNRDDAFEVLCRHVLDLRDCSISEDRTSLLSLKST